MSRGSISRRVVSWTTLLCAVIVIVAPVRTAFAEGNQSMRSLDEQVQEVKSDVLSIAAELSNLEEKLLYPSDTQVAVFVAVTQGDAFQLDSAEIRIDGERVAAHIYTFKELEALKKGGVQRIHTGNVSTGEHQLEIEIVGKRMGGDELHRSQSFEFTKGIGPKLIEISFSGGDTGDGLITLGSR